MTFRIIAIRKGYTPLHALPAEACQRDAHRALVEWSIKRQCAVVLRDGTTGKRTSVGEAMDALGFTWIEQWHPAQGLARIAGGVDS